MPESASTFWRPFRVTAVVALLALALSAFVLGLPAAHAEERPGGGETSSTEAPTTTPTASTSPTTDPSDCPCASSTPSVTPSDTPTASPTATVTPDPDPDPDPTPTSTVTPGTGTPVEGVALRWSISKEANGRSHAPGWHNFFSAGRVKDPGAGGVLLTRKGWSAASGNVTIRKWGPYTVTRNGKKVKRTGWHTATWPERTTDGTGAELGHAGSGSWSQQEMHFSAGTGTLDAARDNADIGWTGDATVVFYEGESLFYITNPRLTVVGGRGQLTATVSGFASSQADQSIWQAVPARHVVLADLPKVDVTDSSFTVQPAYEGVRSPVGQQLTTEAGWGAFPPSLVEFTDRIGTGEFWYSTGGVSDRTKTPLPVTVVVSGADDSAPDGSKDDRGDQGTTTVQQPRQPVAPAPAPAVPGGDLPGAAPAVPQPLTVAAAQALPQTQAVVADPGPAELRAASNGIAPPADLRVWWWAAAALLLATAVLLAVPTPRARTRP